MHHHQPEPPRHSVDWLKIANMERDLYGETFHHAANGCCCDECRARRIEWADRLHEQTREAWHQPAEHHDPIWILPPPRHDGAAL